jgi:DNA-binding winged helix-turn-helix (wHTH) protein
MLAHQVLALASAYDADLAAARRHIDAALALAAGEAAQRIDTLLVRAELELCGGDPAIVVQAASAARNHYAARGRRSCEAHACVVLAAGHTALGGPGDLAMAEEALARSDELITRHGYEALRFRAVLVRAAILGHNHERATAERLLREALAHPAIRLAGLELVLGSALGSRRTHQLPAGIAAQLARLGLHHAVRREAEITIDPTSASIATRHAAVKGRPVACALLACLADHEGKLVPAEVLYCTAWGAREYHPLRHRNRLYVALKRLRQALDEICGAGGGELIETLPGGWRLAAGVVARKTK